MAGIYVHIPYCHSKCAYCDFVSTPAKADETRLVDALTAEYSLRRGEIAGEVKTLYIGGGTPSILSAGALARLIGALPTEHVEELTIEANPEDVTDDKARGWRDMGVNRVSMGIQSLDDGQLRLIGRRHDAATALAVVDTLRRAGIGNINLDLIYALPGQDLESWRRSLEGVLDLRPDHLSAYMLTYEPRTRLTAMLRSGRIEAVDEDTAVAMYRLLTETARARGYEHYEISNFALPGRRSRHNSSYWQSTPYLGLGPSAHSYDGRHRRVNTPVISEYIDAVLSGQTACTVEAESRVDRFNDMLITRLRTAEGLDFAEVPGIRRRQLLTDAYPYLKSGDLVLAQGHIRIPEPSWLISDAIMRDLIQ